MHLTRENIVSWGKFLGLAVPVIGAAVSLMVYLDDARKSLDSIKTNQVSITAELHEQTKDLEEIRKTQGTIVDKVDRRIDKVESEIFDGLMGMATDIGRLLERTK